MRVFRRYLLLQLPDLAAAGLGAALLVGFDVVTPRVGWLLFAGWVAKELLFFPLLRRAYEPSAPHGTAALVGARGVVTSPLSHAGDEGFVRIGSELWRARALPGDAAAEVGAPIRVEAVDGYTLVVAPAAPRVGRR